MVARCLPAFCRMCASPPEFASIDHGHAPAPGLPPPPPKDVPSRPWPVYPPVLAPIIVALTAALVILVRRQQHGPVNGN